MYMYLCKSKVSKLIVNNCGVIEKYGSILSSTSDGYFGEAQTRGA